jgi:hypothetical protein
MWSREAPDAGDARDVTETSDGADPSETAATNGAAAESSLTFSLRELQQISVSRQHEREQARLLAEVAAATARQRERELAAERERIAAEAEQLAEELVWQRAAAESKAVAERLEAAARAEQARAMIELSQTRAATEVTLARVAQARRRPSWLVAVTAVLGAALIGLAGVSWQWHSTAKAIERHADEQRLAIESGQQEIEELRSKMGGEVEKLGALERRLDAAQKELIDAERMAARALLKKVRPADRHPVKGRPKPSTSEDLPHRPIVIPKHCLSNALC